MTRIYCIVATDNLIKVIKRLARETSFEKVFIIGIDGKDEQLSIRTGKSVKDELIKITMSEAVITKEHPSMKLMQYVANVCDEFRKGDFKFLCEHVPYQEIELDNFRPIKIIVEELKTKIRGIFHGKKS
ncbi:hypothetical protein LMB49_10725 [Limosilactobacillus reuteri]|uniref:hypothetical protein n=1 Tax=Limosilactobacillus reuteri TaxID=1598 RepID=UPI001E58AC42|nr:hypothetical protein [Limosilactobacillus reuteri]MCC4370565.1 hypothetical protein [Limosilactobacillus reuteri]MCC4371866.1 hypothetical protein [Limosilactobacillus reuteri]MCC4509337.1 hypothetical protein [Limosilactobacillus reuteri]MCC4509380.1 hypothetical protein [Limosilactobacillus reuteri]